MARVNGITIVLTSHPHDHPDFTS